MRRLLCIFIHKGHDWSRWKSRTNISDVFQIKRTCNRCSGEECMQVTYKEWMDNL